MYILGRLAVALVFLFLIVYSKKPDSILSIHLNLGQGIQFHTGIYSEVVTGKHAADNIIFTNKKKKKTNTLLFLYLYRMVHAMHFFCQMI